MNDKSTSKLAVSGKPAQGVSLKSARELEIMREAGRIVAFAVKRAFAALEPGITTRELDDIARRSIESEGAKPGFLGLYGFPATACISINEEIVHGIPGDRVVQAGDVVTLDCGAVVDGYNSDHAVTQVAGASSKEKEGLINATRECPVLSGSAFHDRGSERRVCPKGSPKPAFRQRCGEPTVQISMFSARASASSTSIPR